MSELPVVKAVITTLDNLPLLQEQVRILRADPAVGEIVVVDNGCEDGTAGWLGGEEGLTVVHRENMGGGPGRNAGLDAAGEFDFVLMLDGGIRPLVNGTAAMLGYLERHPEVDVVSPETMTCFTADPEAAHRRLPEVDDGTAFPQRCLSGTAYALCRARAWDGLRFSEEGPFGRPGWGTDDNEMQCRWNEAGIVHHQFQGVMVYVRKSGSFQRLFRETGIWPNQYGSVYEQRNVKLCQDWRDYFDFQWHANRIDVSCVVVGWDEYPMFARCVKRLHDDLGEVPHEVVFVDNGSTDETKWWLDTFALRWPWGTATVDAGTGEPVFRHEREDLEPVWTGDVVRVDFPENRGAGAAYRAGTEKARGKYVMLFDGDILPVRGSVRALYEWMEAHEEADFACVNAWLSQGEDEDPEFDGTFEGKSAYGLGNYAYGYSIFRREVLEAGARHPDHGPFAGPGAGFEDCYFAHEMYRLGFKGYMFLGPEYYHLRRDGARTGIEEGGAGWDERRRWLQVRYPGIGFGMVFHYDQPPPVHVRRVAIVGLGHDLPGCTAWGMGRALEGICEVGRFDPGDEVPEGFDDYLFTDSQVMRACPDHCRPSVYWAVDLHLPHVPVLPAPERYLERARTMDRVYAAQPAAVEWLRERGVEAEWLPLAADPDFHRPLPEEKVGLPWVALWHHAGKRPAWVGPLVEAIPNGWIAYRGGEEYVTWMNRARCVVNVCRSEEINMRVFEAMATGVPLVQERAKGLERLFGEGEHYRGFSSPEELLEAVVWVQDNPEEAAAMGRRAREAVVRGHTFYNRTLAVFGV